MKLRIAAVAMLFTLSSCANLNPSTITNAVIGHATFPSLSVAVQECVADRPEVRAEIVAPFNRLVDKWAAAKDLKPDASLVVALAGAKAQVAEAKSDWVLIRTTITGAGVDCGPAVASQVLNIETTFKELETAILSNDRAIYVLEWGQLLSSVVLGNKAKVVRM